MPSLLFLYTVLSHIRQLVRSRLDSSYAPKTIPKAEHSAIVLYLETLSKYMNMASECVTRINIEAVDIETLLRYHGRVDRRVLNRFQKYRCAWQIRAKAAEVAIQTAETRLKELTLLGEFNRNQRSMESRIMLEEMVENYGLMESRFMEGYQRYLRLLSELETQFRKTVMGKKRHQNIPGNPQPPY
jgi:hypothetical protein